MNQVSRYLFAYPPKKSVCHDAAKKIESKLGDTQYGVRHGRSTTEQISTLQQILKKSWEHAKDVYTCFVDLGKVQYVAGFLVKSFGLWEYGVDGSLFLAVK